MSRRSGNTRRSFRRPTSKRFASASRAAYQRIVPLLRERGRQGFVRRIHGDLHLGNIVLIGGEPVLFDAIEFSDIIASGDVFYDLAFLLMDLLERRLAPAANIVLNRYLAETRRVEDLDALAAMPFFLSMRAAIRAKVTAARMERPKDGEREIHRRVGARLFRLRHASDRAAATGNSSPSAAFPAPAKSKLARMLAPDVEPDARRRDRALGRRAQSAVRRRRDRKAARGRL